MKRANASDDGSSSSWSNINHDLLFIIMMQLGVVDLVAFSGVCKLWRSFAKFNWKTFMMSKRPMYMFISTRIHKKDCYLEDFEGRKFKTMIPRSTNRVFVGSTRGYLILFGAKTRDFWLVNPITRHEIHFPNFPFNVSTVPSQIKAVLVFSRSKSAWVFLFAHTCVSRISFSIAGGKQFNWVHLNVDHPIVDLHVFKEKIYTSNTNGEICEVKLDPEPMSTPLNFLKHELSFLTFVSSDENLYMIDYCSGNKTGVIGVDLDEVRYVIPNTLSEYSIFASDVKCSAAINPDTWACCKTKHERKISFFCGERRGRCFTTNLWQPSIL